MSKSIWLFGKEITFPRRRKVLEQRLETISTYLRFTCPIGSLPPASGFLRDIQLASLELLKEIDYVCRKNNFRYFALSGTLLGAVRHSGFVPWDDEIDIGMLRGDYEKFIEAFNRDTREKDAFAELVAPSRGFVFMKIRLRNAPEVTYVDIFPIDIHPDRMNDSERSQYIKQLRAKFDACRNRFEKGDAATPYQYYREYWNNEVLKNRSPGTDACGSLCYGCETNTHAVFDCQNIFPLKSLSFEDMEIPAPYDSDWVLTTWYGDYMLPPEQIAPHCALRTVDRQSMLYLKDFLRRRKKP